MSSDLYAFLGTGLIIFLGVVLIVYVLEFNKRQNKHYKEKELLNAQFQQELLQSQLEIQEQTFKNISQEIHDNIGQVLTLAKLNLNTMSYSSSKEDQEKMEGTSELLTKAIQDLRDLSKSLNTDFVIDMGLVKSIEYELNLLKKAAGLQTNLVIEGTLYELSQQKELILFRIFQEVLNNIIKHSRASLLSVAVKYEPKAFSLAISDNGVGFDKSESNSQKQGLGIRNIKNRSNIIGATCTIDSEPGKGTSIKIMLPI